MSTKRFIVLLRRLTELEKHFLPQPFPLVAKEQDNDNARAFQLLAHAEIESYIEDISKTKILSAIGKWKNSKQVGNVLLCFIACYHAGDLDDQTLEDFDKLKSHPKVKKKVEEIIDLAATKYNKLLSSNHGIKLDNLKKLLLPIGVNFDDLDQTWLTDIDNFGKERGSCAHQNKRAYQPKDPKTVHMLFTTTTTGIIAGLAFLDTYINKLK